MTSELENHDVKQKTSLIRKACFKQFGDGWEQPEPEEVAALVRLLEMTWSQVAEFVGQGSSRAARRWLQPAGTSNARKIPYASWRLLVERLGRQSVGKPGLVDLSKL